MIRKILFLVLTALVLLSITLLYYWFGQAIRPVPTSVVVAPIQKSIANTERILSGSFQANSIIWILISVGLAGTITAVIKYIAEQYLPQHRIKRAKRSAIQKYSYPLGSGAFELGRKIHDLISHAPNNKIDKDNFYRLTMLFQFGYFLGWYRILAKEAFLEYSENPKTLRSKQRREFDTHYYMTSRSLTNPLYFEERSRPDDQKILQYMYKYGDYASCQETDQKAEVLFNIESATLDPLIFSAIGDIMIKGTKEASDVMNFQEFAQNYEDCPAFKRWFTHLEHLLSELDIRTYVGDGAFPFRSFGLLQSDAKWNRLVIFLCHLLLFWDYISQQYISITDYVYFYLSPRTWYFIIRYKIVKLFISYNYSKGGKRSFYIHLPEKRKLVTNNYIKSLHPTVRKNLYRDCIKLGYSRKQVNSILNKYYYYYSDPYTY